MTVPVRVSESNIDLVVTCLVSCMLARVSVLVESPVESVFVA